MVTLVSRLLKTIGLLQKKPYKRDDILQKRFIILRSLLVVATPYVTGKIDTAVNANVALDFFLYSCLRHGSLRCET